jgi:hypothetical protein
MSDATYLTNCPECGDEVTGSSTGNPIEYKCGTHIFPQGDDEPDIYLSYDCCIATIDHLRAEIAKLRSVSEGSGRAS